MKIFLKKVFKKKFLRSKILCKKKLALHHDVGAGDQKLGVSERYVRASLKRRAHKLFVQKEFCVRVPVDESEKLEPNWDGEIAILDDF